MRTRGKLDMTPVLVLAGKALLIAQKAAGNECFDAGLYHIIICRQPLVGKAFDR